MIGLILLLVAGVVCLGALVLIDYRLHKIYKVGDDIKQTLFRMERKQ